MIVHTYCTVMVSLCWLYILWTRKITESIKRTEDISLWAKLWAGVTFLLVIASFFILAKTIVKTW